MRSYIFIIILGLLSVTGYSQSVNMQFKGFEKFRDTLQFSSILPSNGYQYAISSTKVITVPVNEVWILDQSIMTYHQNATVIIDSISTCNCISLDGHLLHSILNGNNESYNLEETSTFSWIAPTYIYPYYPDYGYKVRFSSLYKNSFSIGGGGYINGFSFDNVITPTMVSDIFIDRIKLLPGVHRIKRNFMGYNFSSTAVLSLFQHDILFEKYTMQ